MAYGIHSTLASLFILNLLCSAALAGRDIPNNNDSKNAEQKHMTESKNVDVKQPEFLGWDRSVLIPGIGRAMIPEKGHYNPITYNPITGRNTGKPKPTIGSIISGSGAGQPRQYVPGFDDTFVPNPGFEVPLPGAGGSGFPVTPASTNNKP